MRAHILRKTKRRLINHLKFIGYISFWPAIELLEYIFTPYNQSSIWERARGFIIGTILPLIIFLTIIGIIPWITLTILRLFAFPIEYGIAYLIRKKRPKNYYLNHLSSLTNADKTSINWQGFEEKVSQDYYNGSWQGHREFINDLCAFSQLHQEITQLHVNEQEYKEWNSDMSVIDPYLVRYINQCHHITHLNIKDMYFIHVFGKSGIIPNNPLITRLTLDKLEFQDIIAEVIENSSIQCLEIASFNLLTEDTERANSITQLFANKKLTHVTFNKVGSGLKEPIINSITQRIDATPIDEIFKVIYVMPKDIQLSIDGHIKQHNNRALEI